MFANIPGPSVHSSSYDSRAGNSSYPLNSYLPDVSLSLLNMTHPNVPQLGNVQVELTPSMTSYTSSTSYYLTSIGSHFPEYHAPMRSCDGISSMPDPEDVPPLCMDQPLPLDEPMYFNVPSQSHLEEPLPIGGPLPVGEPSGSKSSRKHCQNDIFIYIDPCQKKMRGWVPPEASTSCYHQQTAND
jgi:hypothetical protein